MAVSSIEKQLIEIETAKLYFNPRPVGLASFTEKLDYKQTSLFQIHNDLNIAKTVYLHIGTDNIFKFSSIDVVRSVRGMAGVLALEIKETQKVLYNGYLVPISYRQHPENLQVLSLQIPPQSTYTLHLHIFDLIKGWIPNTKLMNSDSFIQLEKKNTDSTEIASFTGYIFVGAILVMFIFVIAIYSQNKMKDFGMYALYLIALLLVGVLDAYPLSFKDFWGWQFPQTFIYLKESIIYLYLIFYQGFIIYFLNTAKNQKILHKALIIANKIYAFLFLLNFVSIVFFFAPIFIRNLTWLNTYLFYASLLFYIYLFAMIWRAKHIPFSKYIFWGTVSFYLSNFSAILTNIYTKGEYHWYLFPFNFIQIGALVEILFFSVALGRKALLDSEEKNKLQKQVIEQLEEKKQLIQGINERLEREVAEKTEEILAQSQSLQAEKEEKIRLQFGKQLQEMRLYAIQTQLNPHFLFNCLNTIKSLVINQENEKAALYLNRFAKLMRSTLENSEKLKINLKESIEYLKNYVEIEKLRFKEDFDFDISFEGEEAPELLQVPPMLIQPFVENAIIHGLVPSRKSKKLTIKFVEEEKFLICKVKDNGRGFEIEPTNKTHNSKGLKMIQTYFDLWNVQKNEKASFSIQSQVGEGTEVLIYIPI